jgi:hypothetical protein
MRSGASKLDLTPSENVTWKSKLGKCYCRGGFAKVASVHNRGTSALPMLKKARQFAALDLQQKSVLVQAWFMLGWMSAAIILVPFKRLSKSLTHHRESVEPWTLTVEQQNQAIGIGKLVATAAQYTPWQSRCLVQVLVVQRLLARRNIPGQFYLGVHKGAEGGAAPTGLSAHAWLQCGDCIVNGGAGHEAFTVVSTFSWGQAG